MLLVHFNFNFALVQKGTQIDLARESRRAHKKTPTRVTPVGVISRPMGRRSGELHRPDWSIYLLLVHLLIVQCQEADRAR